MLQLAFIIAQSKLVHYPGIRNKMFTALLYNVTIVVIGSSYRLLIQELSRETCEHIVTLM